MWGCSATCTKNSGLSGARTGTAAVKAVPSKTNATVGGALLAGKRAPGTAVAVDRKMGKCKGCPS